MFSVSLIGGAFYTFMTFFLEIVDWSNWFFAILLVPAGMFIAFSYQMVIFSMPLLTSYQFQNGCLVKGRIKDNPEFEDAWAVSQSTLVFSAARALLKGNQKKSFNMITLAGTLKIIKRIICNLDPEFVKRYFDSDVYKKTVYRNVRLVSKGKNSLIFASDEKKKIVVPRIYTGMYESEQPEGPSIIRRIIRRSVLVFILSGAFITGLLIVQAINNPKDEQNIQLSAEAIRSELEVFGYTYNKANSSLIVLTKNLYGDRTSEIKYELNLDGSIKKAYIQLYFNKNSKDVEFEMNAVINTLPYNIPPEERERFIGNVIKSINGEYTYDKLKDEAGTKHLLISKSGGYIDIH